MSNLHNNEQNIETLAREACCAGKLKISTRLQLEEKQGVKLKNFT